jgi:hypothetical protein
MKYIKTYLNHKQEIVEIEVSKDEATKWRLNRIMGVPTRLSQEMIYTIQDDEEPYYSEVKV